MTACTYSRIFVPCQIGFAAIPMPYIGFFNAPFVKSTTAV